MGAIGYLYLSMLMDARACAKCICIFVFYERICVFVFDERKQRKHQCDVRACACTHSGTFFVRKNINVMFVHQLVGTPELSL